MTLEEAIKHCEEVVERNLVDAYIIRINGNRLDMFGRTYEYCIQCAEEHRQLAEWLRELKTYRGLNKNGQ